MRVAFLHVEEKRNNPQLQRRLAQIMVRSVKRAVKDSWLIQMTDFDTPKLDGVDELIRAPMDTPNFMTYRLQHLTRLKGEVLILDTDVIVLEDPSKVFTKPFDVALTKRDKHIVARRMGYTENDPVMTYNTGVMFSRNRDFWKDALAHCRTLEDRHQQWFGDQISVAAIVEQRKYDVMVLPCDKWNYTPRAPDEFFIDKKIVHFKGTARKARMLEFENLDKFSAQCGALKGHLDPYSTHLEALVQTALQTTGGILELGCGHYSTPILEAIAKTQGRPYLSQASDANWASQFNGSVQVISWESWEPPTNPDSPDGKWGMVFLDSEENTWSRVRRIPSLAKVTDTIVLHDAEISMMREGWRDAISAFPDVTIFNRYRPYTAVMRKSCSR